MRTIKGYDVKIFTDNVEDVAIAQIKKLLAIDVFSDKKIRIMPDVHAGAGCVVGFTGNLGDKVIPNIVGVDIGCGMRVVKLGKIGEIDYHAFHVHIQSNVPSGMMSREEACGFKPLVGEELEIYREADELVSQLYCCRMLKDRARISNLIGTLGGGNHFIELDSDDDGNVYMVIHTGSRNLGKQVADIYQALAVKHLSVKEEIRKTIKRIIEEYKAAGRQSELQEAICKMHEEQGAAVPAVDPEMCYVEGVTREQYLHDMRLCQRWAILNRKLIARLLMKFFAGVEAEDEFESVHNYISDDNIIRKGAISAALSERCIIPLNMRDGALLCTGKGNADWNCSAPHSAGRVLSRSAAFEKITMADFEESMRGIYSESVTDLTRDESPMVYKPAKDIINNIGDTVNIDAIVRPLFNFKAST
ncbi:MAG: RtcB family protein [Muribaculaceae bacterium]